jgi:hypothetical protein
LTGAQGEKAMKDTLLKDKTQAELLALAIKNRRRQKDDSINSRDLEEALASLIHIDVEAEKLAKAKTIIDRQSKTGMCEIYGQQHFAGFETYAFEPDRLVKNEDLSRIVEQKRASLAFKVAESARSQRHSIAAAKSSARKSEEAQQMALWVVKQQTKGRKESELNYWNFISEAGIWDENPPETKEREEDTEE